MSTNNATGLPTPRCGPCFRAPVTQTVAERREAHRRKMAAKRSARPMQSGFTPVPNARISKAISIATASIMFAAAQRGSPINQFDAERLAIDQVRRQLPPPRRAYDWANGLPTRNDNPEYRK